MGKKHGEDNQSQGNGVTTDNNGNVYSTGYFKGTSDLDPSSNDFDVTSIGDKDIYVQKLDSNGFFNGEQVLVVQELILDTIWWLIKMKIVMLPVISMVM